MKTENRSTAERWEANLRNGSESYAAVSGRRPRAFCRRMQATPEELASLDVADLRRLLEDFLADERKKSHSGGYIGTTVKAVRSWREYNGKESPKGLRIPNARLHPRVDAESTPTTCVASS